MDTPIKCLEFLTLEGPNGLESLAIERLPTKAVGLPQYMCDICHTVNGRTDMARFTRRSRDGLLHVSFLLCAKLGCRLFVHGLKKPDSVQMQEFLTLDDKTGQLSESYATHFQTLQDMS